MKMILTLKVEWDVDDLSEYEADNLDDAVKNQLKWFNDGSADIIDFVDDMEIVSLVGID